MWWFQSGWNGMLYYQQQVCVECESKSELQTLKFIQWTLFFLIECASNRCCACNSLSFFQYKWELYDTEFCWIPGQQERNADVLLSYHSTHSQSAPASLLSSGELFTSGVQVHGTLASSGEKYTSSSPSFLSLLLASPQFQVKLSSHTQQQQHVVRPSFLFMQCAFISLY